MHKAVKKASLSSNKSIQLNTNKNKTKPFSIFQDNKEQLPVAKAILQTAWPSLLAGMILTQNYTLNQLKIVFFSGLSALLQRSQSDTLTQTLLTAHLSMIHASGALELSTPRYYVFVF